MREPECPSGLGCTPRGRGDSEYSTDGHQILALASGSVQQWDTNTGNASPLPISPRPEESTKAYNENGHLLALSDGDETRIVDARTMQPIGAPIQHDLFIDMLVFSPDGQRLAAGNSFADEISVWDARTGQSVGGPLQTNGWVQAIAFSADASMIAGGGLTRPQGLECADR